jgi:GT2 family glycosyltransferase
VIRFFCCANNRQKVKGMLLRGLQRQTVPYTLHMHWNTSEKNTGVATVYNQLFAEVRPDDNDWCFFIHQDVEFMEPKALSTAIRMMEQFESVGGGLFGFAGAKYGAGRVLGLYNTENRSSEVQTLDELCIALRAKWLRHLGGFDENLPWHCYGVDLSLQTSTAGRKVYVVAAPVKHYSDGNPNAGSDGTKLVDAQNYVLNKWKDRYREIWTTCGELW